MGVRLGRGGRRAKKTLSTLVTALAYSIALAACGGGDAGGASDEDQVREIAEQLIGNDPAVCGKITENLMKQLGTKEECEKSAGDVDDEGARPSIEEVGVDGETATAVIVDEDRSTIKFVKQDGEWLADGVDVEEGAGKAGSGEE